jgi:hypothetical protein
MNTLHVGALVLLVIVVLGLAAGAEDIQRYLKMRNM